MYDQQIYEAVSITYQFSIRLSYRVASHECPVLGSSKEQEEHVLILSLATLHCYCQEIFSLSPGKFVVSTRDVGSHQFACPRQLKVIKPSLQETPLAFCVCLKTSDASHFSILAYFRL